MCDGIDKHMSEPMIVTLTDLSLLFFYNCVLSRISEVNFVEFFQELYGHCFLADLTP